MFKYVLAVRASISVEEIKPATSELASRRHSEFPRAAWISGGNVLADATARRIKKENLIENRVFFENVFFCKKKSLFSFV
jgi:hypothetical protein